MTTMEIESSPQLVAKKLCNVLRIVLYMLKKGITNCKFIHDVHLMFKRGKLAGKAINDLMLHLQEDYTDSLTCRSADIRSSIVNRREYEFSCSNSPAYPAQIFSRRKTHSYQYYNHKHHQHKHKDLQKMFDILNSYEKFDQSQTFLPGFGQSPMVRQLRVTDSPYPVKDYEENPQVDKDAEDFINKFYKDLKLQHRVAAVESPSPYHYRGR